MFLRTWQMSFKLDFLNIFICHWPIKQKDKACRVEMGELVYLDLMVCRVKLHLEKI